MTAGEARLGKRSLAAFLGVQFDQIDESHAMATIADFARRSGFRYVVTPNVDHLVRLHSAQADAQLWRSYQEASLCVCDSRILQKLAAVSGQHLELVLGSDLTARLLDCESENLSRAAVIGGDETLLRELAKRYPQWEWHQHIPPMGVRTDPAAQAEIIAFVENCSADLFLFAIGSPQSELICAQIMRRGQARGVGLCIGASLEFLTGVQKRAPRWMQKAALEWLFRLISEPRRLWRRYLVEGPAIFRIWWAWQFRGARHSSGFGSTPPDGN